MATKIASDEYKMLKKRFQEWQVWETKDCNVLKEMN